MKLYTFFNFASIVAAEKRPYATIFQQAALLWHSDLANENALWGWKIGGKLGKEWSILTPNEKVLTFGVPVYGVKFHQN